MGRWWLPDDRDSDEGDEEEHGGEGEDQRIVGRVREPIRIGQNPCDNPPGSDRQRLPDELFSPDESAASLRRDRLREDIGIDNRANTTGHGEGCEETDEEEDQDEVGMVDGEHRCDDGRSRQCCYERRQHSVDVREGLGKLEEDAVDQSTGEVPVVVRREGFVVASHGLHNR